MTRYLNLNGDSGVVGYEIGSDSIIVQFNSGWKYQYDYNSSGRTHIEKMKILAQAGSGLNGYIKANVNRNFVRKFK